MKTVWLHRYFLKWQFFLLQQGWYRDYLVPFLYGRSFFVYLDICKLNINKKGVK